MLPRHSLAPPMCSEKCRILWILPVDGDQPCGSQQDSGTSVDKYSPSIGISRSGRVVLAHFFNYVLIFLHGIILVLIKAISGRGLRSGYHKKHPNVFHTCRSPKMDTSGVSPLPKLDIVRYAQPLSICSLLSDKLRASKTP